MVDRLTRKVVAWFPRISCSVNYPLIIAKLRIEHVYFVEAGLVSVVATAAHGEHAVEAWLIGTEGMAGVPVVLGENTTPHRRTIQAEGSAWCMTSADLRKAMADIPAFRELLLRYVHSVLVQTAQSGACNAQHALNQRLARWLLMAQDRLDSADLPLTHNVIGKMLGVRRASITIALQALEGGSG